MATTRIWPIKYDIATTINYAVNPEKTKIPDNVKDDENEKLYFVHSLNCVTNSVSKRMKYTKFRFSKFDGIQGYHAYQSFNDVGLSAKEAHNIAIETATALWGNDYEVLIATHQNTKNIHSHFIINSVSYKTGKKFKFGIRCIEELREVSDRICKIHNLSVLTGSRFISSSKKKEYYVVKSGLKPRKQIIEEDIEWCLHYSLCIKDFIHKMKFLGCEVVEDDYHNISIYSEGFPFAIPITSYREEWDLETIMVLFEEHRTSINWKPPIPFLLSRKSALDEVSKNSNEIESPIKKYLYLLDEFDHCNPFSKDRLLNRNIKFDSYKILTKIKSISSLEGSNISTVDELYQHISELKTQIKSFKSDLSSLNELIKLTTNPDKIKMHKNEIDILTEKKNKLQNELNNFKNITYLRDISLILINQEKNLENALFNSSSVEKPVEIMLSKEKELPFTR